MRIKYLFKRIIHLDYKNMFIIAKKLSKKTKKNTISILIDMANCGLKYQAGYYDYQEFEFYNLNKKERETYLTRGKNDAIVKKYNNKDYWYKFDDKIEFNKTFKKYLKREYLDIRNCSKKEFENFIKNKKEIIVKPIDGDGGHGIEIVSTKEKDLFNKLMNNKQYLLEEIIIQDKEMNKLYDKSVNTLRMFTFYQNGKSYFLQGILKIGNGGVIDNFSSGGMYTFVSDEGYVIAPAIDQEDNIFETHPISNTKIVGFKVPKYKEAIKLVKEAAKIVPEIGYVGWDVAISENGPVLIEGNCFPGVFQIKPSLSNKKEGILPTYNKVMK